MRIRQLISNNKHLLLIALMLVICISAGVFGMTSLASDIVVVDQAQNPDLTFAKISSGSTYASKGELSQSGPLYTLKTNSFTAWYDQDDIDFAYRKCAFNYGKLGKITVETTISSWDAVFETASAGILLRSSLSPSAASVFLNARPQGIYLLYRYNDGVAYQKGQSLETPISASYYPIKMRVILENNKATASYKTAKDTNWVPFSGTVPCIINTGEVYAGIAAHTSVEADLKTAVFDGFSAVVEAPDDYEPVSSDSPTSSEPDDTLVVEDMPHTADTLLRETFSDGTVFDGEASIDNPIWNSKVMDPLIVTDAERTNRYLHQYYVDDGYYTAGDETWTDYTTSVDLTFPADILPDAQNSFTLLVRFQSIAQYGFASYAVRLIDGNTLQLGYYEYKGTVTATPTWFANATIPLNYLVNLGTTHALRVDTFDNVIDVYWDGVKVISQTDTLPSARLTGSIGFITTNASVMIDNILVRKLADPLGGDYDNKIGGRFDLPIPDYIKNYASKGWTY